MKVIDFEYAGKRLSDFGCIMCNIDSGTSVERISVGCDITFETVKNRHTSIHSITSSAYENVYTTTFDITKFSCRDSNNVKFMTTNEVRELMRWLNQRIYHKLRFFSEYLDATDIIYYGSFNAKQVTYGDDVLGLELTFTSNAPYGFAEEIFVDAFIYQPNDSITLFCDNDDLVSIYPRTEIKCLTNGDLKIKNITTGKTTSILNCQKDEQIIIDGTHKIIYTNSVEHPTLPSDFNYEYIEIYVDDELSENIYEISMPCEIKFIYSPIRKVGVC